MRDPYGLTLSTNATAATAYHAALRKVLLVRSGAEHDLAEAVRADPGFALGHAGLALLGHEYGARVDVPAALAAAERARRGSDRERSQVGAVAAHIRGDRAGAVQAHLREYPRDALMLSVAVPTIAFAGVTEVPQEAWALVEGLAPAYGDDWWYAGLLAFVRQEQERWDEAARLADRALAEEPASGHAVHARTHVYYETGDHAAGLGWLNGWIRRSAPQAHHGAHFCWHAALHELALDDAEAMQRRYRCQLAPPRVTGIRALVDSASLLWRAELAGAWDGPVPVGAVLDVVDPAVLARPRTAFAAWHAAVALAAAGDAAGLGRLGHHVAGGPAEVFPTVVAPLVAGLRAYVEGRYDAAATLLVSIRSAMPALGGSAAQREVLEDTLLQALVAAGRLDEARRLLVRRLDRRPSRRDLRMLQPVSVG
jgi:tetratricopeptide (TPR) repeat protein